MAPERPAPRLTLAGDQSLAAHSITGYYADEPFIRVADFDNDANCVDGFFDVEGSNDTSRVNLFVFGHDDQVVVIGRLDNLGKGASGAAVQSMNVHLGVEETLGLV